MTTLTAPPTPAHTPRTRPFEWHAPTGSFTAQPLPHTPPGLDSTDLPALSRTLLRHAEQAGAARPGVVGAVPFRPGAAPHLRPVDLAAPVAALSIPALPVPTLKRAVSVPDAAGFEALVAAAVQTLRAGRLDKVVLGRLLDLHLHAAPDPDAVLARLRAAHPAAYAFALPLPDDTTLIGASPELLLRRAGRDVHLRPMAGTRPRPADPAADPADDAARAHALLHSAKDRAEHALMVQAIADRLAPLCRTLSVPRTPELASTATLWHLATPIHAQLRDDSSGVLDLVPLIHPTPAVCGVPTGAAQAYLEAAEPFDRGWFGGAVGWADEYGDGEWAVTIRCAELRGTHARLFAGAGLVADSDPTGERQETAAKFGTVLAALGFTLADLPDALLEAL
ncbi:isochorismate synthase MenF [Deinococcus sp.]|uniref:isochorismate synthase n=1 Tax=Deinococcus sp. TaxID=47478 RepID=UPI00391912D2